MSEHRYPRRFVHRSRNTAWAYAEQCGPDEFIYGKNDDGSINGITSHAEFIPNRWVAGSLDEWLLPNGHWIETFDHHKDESGMYQHFSAAVPSPYNGPVASEEQYFIWSSDPQKTRAEIDRLRAEVERLRSVEATLEKITDAMIPWLSKHHYVLASEAVPMMLQEIERLTKENASQKSELCTLGESVKWLTTIRDELTKQARLYRDENDRLIESVKGPNGWESTSALQLQQIDDARKERDELRAKLCESEAAAAKMREALEFALPETRETRGVESWVVTFDDGRDWHCGAEPFMRLCDVFYSATAGREFLAEREKMREEVESLKVQLDQERGRVETMGSELLACVNLLHAFNRLADADRIADLLGVQRPSDHEKEDLQPLVEALQESAAEIDPEWKSGDSEWPEVWESPDGRTITIQHAVGVLVLPGENWKLVSKGGKPVKGAE